MHGEPDGRLACIRPFDAVSDMGRDFEPVAGYENAGLGIAVDQHGRRARDHADPFAFRLVVPEALRARLPGRDDAFDADAGAGE